MPWNYQLDIFRQNVGLEAFDKVRDNNFVVRDEGTSRQSTRTEENVTAGVGICIGEFPDDHPPPLCTQEKILNQ